MSDHGLLAELDELERRGWDSLRDGTAATFYGDVMTEHGTMVLANGSVMDRDGVVAALRGAPPWTSYDLADVRLVPITDDSAALVYVGTAQRDGDPPVVAAMSSVYCRDGDRWELALYQQTPVVHS